MYAPYSHLRPAFLLLLISGLLVQGCGSATVTSTATPAQATIAAAGVVSATTLSGGAPTPASGPLTWDDGSRAVAIHPLMADAEPDCAWLHRGRQVPINIPKQANSMGGFTYIGYDHRRRSATWAGERNGLAMEPFRWCESINGSSSANTGKGNASDGAGQDALIGTRAAFDASVLSTVSKSVRLRVVTDLARQPSGVQSGPPPPGAAPTPQPTQLLPASALVPSTRGPHHSNPVRPSAQGSRAPPECGRARYHAHARPGAGDGL